MPVSRFPFQNDSATTIGAMDRTPKDDELQRGIVGYGLSNVVGALLGGLPTATYSQNVGIVTHVGKLASAAVA